MNGFSRAGSYTMEHKSKVCVTIVATKHVRPQPKPPAYSQKGNYTQSYLPQHSIEWGREPGIHVTNDNIPYYLCSMTSIYAQVGRSVQLHPTVECWTFVSSIMLGNWYWVWLLFAHYYLLLLRDYKSKSSGTASATEKKVTNITQHHIKNASLVLLISLYAIALVKAQGK